MSEGKERRLVPYRKRKTTRLWPGWFPGEWEAEPGDLMVHPKEGVVRLVESRGWYKQCAGELTWRKLRPPVSLAGAKAVLHDGKVFWEIEEDDT